MVSVKTSARPELKEPVQAFAAKLAEGRDTIPLAEFAALFGADEALLERIRQRGDIVFKADTFSNDGPDMVVPANKVEIEIPSLLHGAWSVSPGGFTLTFKHKDFTVRACAQVAILRKCFDLRELRATPEAIELDFGGTLADRRYTF